MKDLVLDRAVCLRRNFSDLPFDADANEETARKVQQRVSNALESAGEKYAYLPVGSIPQDKRELMQQKRLLSPDAQDALYGTAYLRLDERLCVEAAGEDHFRVSAYTEEEDVLSCLQEARRVARQISETGAVAHSDTFGFLTAKPCDAGLGLTVSHLLHLPMTAMIKQISAAMKLAASAGLILRGAGMNGFFLLENRVSSGAAEETLLEKVEETSRKLCALEMGLRSRAKEHADAAILDRVWRAYGICRYTRRMGQKELMQLWSQLTLGRSVCEMPYTEDTLDELRRIALLPEGKLTGERAAPADVERAARVRALFDGGK